MEVRGTSTDLRNRSIDDVHDALVKALLAYRMLQERCVRGAVRRRTDERLARRP
jgi:hypothetical protein